MKKQHEADLILLAVTLSWGVSFILTKNTLDAISTFNFLSIRFLISAVTSALIFYKRIIKLDKTTIKCGSFIGFIMFCGYAVQTIGLNYTTVSKSAFISGFAVVIVPVLSSILLKKLPKSAAVLGVIFAMVGLALLTLDGDLKLNIGDFYTLICAFFFAFHILAVSKYAIKVDPINLAIVQIGVVGILSTFVTFLFENPILPKDGQVWFDLLFLSFICTSGAFIVQNAVQKYTTATHTALIFASEPMFASMFSYFMVGEVLTTRGIIGALFILSGMLIAELGFQFPFIKMKSSH